MITYADICHQVADALKGISGATVQAYDEIQESIAVYPTLHVYLDGGETGNEGTDRLTYGAGTRVTTCTIKVDGYARVRSHIFADMAAQIDLADAIDNVLSAQVETLYGTPHIKAHHWSWERGILEYAKKDYAAVTFTLTLTIF
jgi:hypothetical protein